MPITSTVCALCNRTKSVDTMWDVSIRARQKAYAKGYGYADIYAEREYIRVCEECVMQLVNVGQLTPRSTSSLDYDEEAHT